MAIKKKKSNPRLGSNGNGLRGGGRSTPTTGKDLRTYSIPDMRLEHPDVSVR